MSKRHLFLAPALAFAVLAPALAAEPVKVDPELATFRQAYTAGDGLAYVVIPGDQGERVYRYGDASREAAKKDQ